MTAVEGGSAAYCAECQERGHYQTAHHLRPIPPPPIPWGPSW